MRFECIIARRLGQMVQRYIPRTLEPVLSKAAREFPAVVITGPRQSGKTTLLPLWKGFLRGGYPELIAEPNRDLFLWHASYVQTYLERDVRSLRQVGDLTLFQGFLRMLATRSGKLLNLTEMGRDLGIAVNTARAWLSVLEATFQVIILRLISPTSASVS